MAEKVIKDAMLQKAVEQAVMELVRFEHGRDQSVIHLPIWLPNGTGITVTVRRTGSLVEVSDDGAAYGEAEDAMMHKSFARNAPDFATPLGVTYEAKAFSIRDVSLDNIAGAVAMVAEAAKRTFDVTVERAAERKTAEVNEVPPESYVSKVLALRAKGLSQDAIAKELHMSQAVISRVLRQNGLPTALRPEGATHGMWKGGKTATGQGYIQCMVALDDPMASMRSRSGYVLEHRLVVARAIGRPLEPRETVHHINGDRKDNRLENLQLRQSAHGTGVVFVCAECGSRHIKPVALD
jgi:ribosome-binding protein aMBF1 (putative translation factor)